MRMRMRVRTWKNPAWWFLLPSFAGVCIFYFIPYIDVFRRAFFSAAGGEFQGLDNFKTVLTNPAFQLAVKNTGLFMLVCIPLLLSLSLVIAVIVSLLMLVLGNEIQKAVSRYIPFLGRVLGKILGARALLVFGVLFLVFLMLYKVLPNRKATFKSQIPGALIIAVAWSIFSYGFSFYFEIFPGFSNMYGNLATIIMVMVWLYICMNLLLYGAEINAYFEKEFRIAHKSVQELLAHEKEKKQQENE